MRVEVLLVVEHLLEVLGIRVELGSEVQIMQKGVSLMSHAHKACIESWHKLVHFGQVDVAHRERCRLAFLLVFHQSLVFCQRDGNLLGLNVDVEFAGHRAIFTERGLLALVSVLSQSLFTLVR